MRGIDLDTSGKIWLYRPGSDQGPHGTHKTAWRGHQRIIAIGPRAQQLLKRWLRLNVGEFLFQPRESVAMLGAERRQQRKTPMTPSQARRRRKTRPLRSPGERYTVGAYGRAIERAAAKAAVPPWNPNQIRHSRATEIRREFGLDAARVVLGHRSPGITEVYAELDANKATEVMERLG
jgi:integrase